MSGPTITMCPTLSNPDAFNSVSELRQELHRANDSLLQLADQLHETRHVLQCVGETLTRLVIGHMQGRHEFVKSELDAIVATHVEMKPKPQGGMH